MKKRTFLKNLGLGAGATILLPNLLTSCGPSAEDDFKLWVWTGGNDKDDAQWMSEFKRLADAGFHGVFVGGGAPVLEKAIPAAKANGLEIHAWVWVTNQPGNKEAQVHPEWYAISRDGNSSLDVRPYVDYYQWLCPSKPEVQEFLFNKLMAVCDIDGLDGIQLDYVRYCDVILPRGLWEKYDLVQDHEMAEFDFCYCETCRSKFSAEHGYDPLELDDATADENWRKFRYDSITNLVNKLAAGVHERKKQISASVFATPELARKFVRQAWDEWDLDFVMPMIYYDFYAKDHDFIKTGTEEGVAALKGRIPLYTAQYLSDKNIDDVKMMVQNTKAGGANGMALFNYSLMNNEFLEVIKTAKT